MTPDEQVYLIEYEPIDYAEIRRCDGCLKYYESPPVDDDNGNAHCSQDCANEEPRETLFNENEDI